VKRQIQLVLAALSVLLLLQPAPTRAQTSDIVERVLARYAEMETMQARFEQRMISNLFEDEEVITGSLYMRGAAYRILTGTRTIVTDGETSWIHDAVENQVLVDYQIEDEFTFSVHQFLYAFDERFEVAGVVRTGNSWRVALSPRDPDDYFRSLELVVRDSDAIITEIQVDDANEVRLQIQLTDIRENPPLSDALFRFEIPPGVDVVDLRSD
jgi:outer membrane lipoprotein carrier protein